ncbi:hypothetical protein AJ78_06060 [Emergomyces pasteurianus Ep9510]|uniref:Uncharacterized protein n=1 Tax=Emergomyces pasteurianus Ep9510 TaxID=1447872 RepID=A0A1J9PAF0_9EURO|nr:hypothetical protein AJ78_06060 [Emergomyces pasteurianus Ep9510]
MPESRRHTAYVTYQICRHQSSQIRSLEFESDLKGSGNDHKNLSAGAHVSVTSKSKFDRRTGKPTKTTHVPLRQAITPEKRKEPVKISNESRKVLDAQP